MSNNLERLAARRAELVAQCALQREHIAQELVLLRSPFSLLSVDGLRERFAGHGKLVLAAGGVALGLAAMRPKRLLSFASRGLSLVGTVRKILPLLAR